MPAPSREIARNEIAKGYEYEKDRFVMLSREELAKITPQTAREMQILEFVKPDDVDPIYFETSYYMIPDRGGERAYGLLFEALRQSGFVGVAQLAMHNREHIALIRPGKSGLVLHTMFYEDEVRRSEEYRTDAAVAPKELELAMMLVNNLAAPFDPSKYHDTYREKVEALIQAKIAGKEVVDAPAARTGPVVNILEALQQSLQQSARDRKPAGRQEEAAATPPSRRKRK
jgi:DNA end-binding protein Ku